MHLDQLVDQGEANSRTFIGAGARAFHPMKTIKDARQILLRYPDPGIGHPQLDPISRLTQATAILPSKVNLKAFEMRLRTIFSHISRST